MKVKVTFKDGKEFELTIQKWLESGRIKGFCKSKKLLEKNITGIEYIN